MGTHMWSNGASRRGRRMSLELPLNRPMPLNPQDTEFLQRRPDLFYPYLPAPFLSGMQAKVSLAKVSSKMKPILIVNIIVSLRLLISWQQVGHLRWETRRACKINTLVFWDSADFYRELMEDCHSLEPRTISWAKHC